VTRKRAGAKRETPRANGTEAPINGVAPSNGVAPITGVASGSRGTAANLDDTQVMRTADLERAAAEAGVAAWLTDGAAPEPENVPVPERVRAPDRVKPRERAKAPTQARTGLRVGRRTSALAGAAVGASLMLLAGAALLGSLGTTSTNPGLGQGPPFAESSLEPFATPSAEPSKEGKGCHGKGKGNDCKD
jgi:hypothetical protein